MWKRLRSYWPLILILYVHTWIAGWISHDRELRTRATSLWNRHVEWEQRAEAYHEPKPSRPRYLPGGAKTGVSWCVPILPGVLLANSHYVVVPMYGKGGYKVVMYYGWGSREVLFAGWVS
jgi:hypothetical protein